MPAPTCYKTSNEGGEEEESFISRLTRGVKGLSRKGTRGGHESRVRWILRSTTLPTHSIKSAKPKNKREAHQR